MWQLIGEMVVRELQGVGETIETLPHLTHWHLINVVKCTHTTEGNFD